ncbi:hypothetical protein POVWA2_021650 [Plasmodium ovale wallikeri]|uniref:Uncharacterized protein n=1 Tax=Plasmodium ovale wallikeri TaxID=864142 RepID=A0A1A8YSA9_PLAOA|nr:hypothetical protein POVWA1_021670 [Plasmodium ovale wallikeri]SBT34764.1 hypothetical protein POVWA2_021650 [Plasmodium ovale wallikeri]
MMVFKKGEGGMYFQCAHMSTFFLEMGEPSLVTNTNWVPPTPACGHAHTRACTSDLSRRAQNDKYMSSVISLNCKRKFRNANMCTLLRLSIRLSIRLSLRLSIHSSPPAPCYLFTLYLPLRTLLRNSSTGVLNIEHFLKSNMFASRERHC